MALILLHISQLNITDYIGAGILYGLFRHVAML